MIRSLSSHAVLASRFAFLACSIGSFFFTGCPGSPPTSAIPITPTVQSSKQPAIAAHSAADNEIARAPSDIKPKPETPAAAPTETPAVEPKKEGNVAATKQPPGEIVPINFDDLNINMQADIVFRPWMLTDRVKELEGKRIRLNGYMHGGVSQLKKIKEFVLLKNTECKFGPGGQADHLIQVKLQGDVSASFSATPIQVEGVLKLSPVQGPDGNTWSVYDLLGEAVKPVRK